MLRLVAALVLCAAFVFSPAPQLASQAPIEGCAATTLRSRVSDRNGDGRLECGPGEGLRVRQDLAKATSKRAKQRRHLATFVTLADFQLPDEESPLRGEWLDKCEDQPAKGAFR